MFDGTDLWGMSVLINCSAADSVTYINRLRVITKPVAKVNTLDIELAELLALASKTMTGSGDQQSK
jgi:hypothetical protein